MKIQRFLVFLLVATLAMTIVSALEPDRVCGKSQTDAACKKCCHSSFRTFYLFENGICFCTNRIEERDSLRDQSKGAAQIIS